MTKITFSAFRFFTEIIIAIFIVKFIPCSGLEVTFVVLIHFPDQATAFFSNASWPCLHFNITTALYARIFDSVRTFLHFFSYLY